MSEIRPAEDGLDWAHRPSTGGEGRGLDGEDIPEYHGHPTLAVGLAEQLRATLEGGMDPEELAERLARLIEVMVEDIGRQGE